MVKKASIIQSGRPHEFKKAKNYEKTTLSNEKVAGLVMMRGTADTQLMLNDGSSIPTAVADRQTGRGAIDPSTNLYDDEFAVDGQPIKAWAWGDFIWLATLAVSQTIVSGDKLMAIALGQVAKLTTGKIQCAVATEDKTTVGSIDETLMALWTGPAFEYP